MSLKRFGIVVLLMFFKDVITMNQSEKQGSKPLSE
jgi:hypothetical protein